MTLFSFQNMKIKEMGQSNNGNNVHNLLLLLLFYKTPLH